MNSPHARPVDILMVEDSEGDVYLRRAGKYRDAVKPDLIFLDLNLPPKAAP